MYPERVLKALQRAQAHVAAGNPQAAIADLDKVVKKVPKAWDAWSLLGQAKGQIGDHAAAEQCFRRACTLNPKDPGLWANLGISHSIRGQYRDALAAYVKSATLSETPHPDTLHNIGSCYIHLDHYAEAVDLFQEVIQLKDTADTWALLGIAWQGLDRYPEALAAYQKAQTRGGDGYTLHLNIGTCHDTLGDFVAAAESARAALGVQPDDPVAHYNLGSACLGMGDLAGALDAFARSTLPDAAQARLMAMQYQDGIDPRVLRAEHEAFAAQYAPAAQERPVLHLADGEPLRIGLVSADFREHPVAYFLEGLLSQIDRQRIALFLYSDVRTEDATTARFRKLANVFHSTASLDDTGLAAQVRQDRIHLLIDLAGHGNGSRLMAFAQRPAPVQASYLGYAGTTGLPAIDYVLLDAHLAPAGTADAQYSERVIRLGDLFASYTPPTSPEVASPLPMLRTGAPTFGSFAQLRKISPKTIDRWIAVLKRLPDSRLLVMSKGLDHATVQDRFLAPFLTAGIDHARIELRGAGSMADFLQAHHDIDLILDTLPWNGHTTTLHGIWMGVPTVTLSGCTHPGRFGELVNTALALPELITTSEQFAETVAGLVTNVAHLAELRAGLRERLINSPLCDHQQMATRFTEACWTMWQQARA